MLFFYTPLHRKRRGIMLYPPNFECPSGVYLSVCLSALRFRALTLVPFGLFLQTLHRHWYLGGVYGIASGLISFWNNRGMALYLCKKCFALRFRALNFSTFLLIFFKLRIDIGIGEKRYGVASGIISFRNNRKCLWPLIYVQNAFLVNILRMNRQISIKFCICIA